MKYKWEESKTMDLNVELHLGCGSCRNVVIVSVVVSVFVTVFNQWQIICICLVWWWLSEAGLSRWKGGMQKAQVWHFGPLTQEAGVQRHYEVDISKAAKTFPVPLWLFCSANLQQGKISNFRPKKSSNLKKKKHVFSHLGNLFFPFCCKIFNRWTFFLCLGDPSSPPITKYLSSFHQEASIGIMSAPGGRW